MASEYGKQKVAYQFNSSEHAVHVAGLKNLQNHLLVVGAENLTAVAVIHGAAWSMVAKQTAQPENLQAIERLRSQGVDFRICSRTLQENGLEPGDLFLEFKLIPGGVAELTKLQQDGFAYIKP